MDLYNILVMLLIGAVAGWLAGIIMNSKGSLLRNIILGIVGGFVGGWIFSLLNTSIALSLGPINVGTIIVSAIGACILIFVGKILFK